MTYCGVYGLWTVVYIIVVDMFCAANFANTLKNTKNKTYLNSTPKTSPPLTTF